MPAPASLIGSATRYIAGRNAVQTVYWRGSSGSQPKLVKHAKTCSFGKSATPPEKIREMQQCDFSAVFRMPNSTNLIGSATRYISGRNAVQTVYWIRPSDGSQHKFLKLSKICNFKKAPTPPPSVRNIQHDVKFYK